MLSTKLIITTQIYDFMPFTPKQTIFFYFMMYLSFVGYNWLSSWLYTCLFACWQKIILCENAEAFFGIALKRVWVTYVVENLKMTSLWSRILFLGEVNSKWIVYCIIRDKLILRNKKLAFIWHWSKWHHLFQEFWFIWIAFHL